MGALLALLTDQLARRRLERVVRQRSLPLVVSDLTITERWAELHLAAVQCPAALAVVDPYASGRVESGAIKVFRRAFPCIGVVAYGDFDRHSSRDAVRLMRLGVIEIVIRDREDAPHAFARILARAMTRSTSARMLDGLRSMVPPHLHGFVGAVLRKADRPLSPGEAARLYHRHPNTLREHLRAAGLPSVNKLIVWMRLLHAAHHLEDSGTSAERVASLLRFPSGTAFRNQLHRYVGVTPGELRERGGMSLVLDRFCAGIGSGSGAAWAGGAPVASGRGGDPLAE